MCARYIVLFVLSTIFVGLIHGDSPNLYRGYVTKTNNIFQVYSYENSSYIPPNNTAVVVAEGYWDISYNITGWSVLEIVTYENQTNIDQVYAAGLLEGHITQEYITYQKLNNIDDVCRRSTDFCAKLEPFLRVQLYWMYDQIKKYPESDYWHQINLLLIQLNGLIDGYSQSSKALGPRNIIDDPINGLFLFQIVESTGDLAARLKIDMTNFERPDSCSALIKILPEFQDILVSHADWSHYRTMLKVIKRYKMSLKYLSGNGTIPGGETIFSSYPGTLHSIDDFYMNYPSNMIVIETTIDNHNDQLFNNILPISVPEWMRIVVANRLSNNGPEWMNKFFLFNDGTYSNQWMVSDYKKFTPKNQPEDGFLTIGEQMITYYKWEDFTSTLRNASYWASYNNVYYPIFRNYSKENDKAAELPQLYSWSNSSRANIFRRNHVDVKDEASMMKLMRYNNFTTDNFSRCDCPAGYSAELSIAARCDLNPAGNYSDPALGRRPHGATDAKIGGYNLLHNRLLNAIAGPTSENQPAFKWSESDYANMSHIGHPDVWNFTTFSPTWHYGN